MQGFKVGHLVKTEQDVKCRFEHMPPNGYLQNLSELNFGSCDQLHMPNEMGGTLVPSTIP